MGYVKLQKMNIKYFVMMKILMKLGKMVVGDIVKGGFMMNTKNNEIIEDELMCNVLKNKIVQGRIKVNGNIESLLRNEGHFVFFDKHLYLDNDSEFDGLFFEEYLKNNGITEEDLLGYYYLKSINNISSTKKSCEITIEYVSPQDRIARLERKIEIIKGALNKKEINE